jgi:hypothetical protein
VFGPARGQSGIEFVEKFDGMQPGSVGLHVESNDDSGEFTALGGQMLHHLRGGGVQAGVEPAAPVQYLQ